jgi:hypothetical protein
MPSSAIVISNDNSTYEGYLQDRLLPELQGHLG